MPRYGRVCEKRAAGGGRGVCMNLVCDVCGVTSSDLAAGRCRGSLGAEATVVVDWLDLVHQVTVIAPEELLYYFQEER